MADRPPHSKTIVGYTPSPNLKYDRSMLSTMMNSIFSRLVEKCYDLKNYAFIRPLKGDARTNIGDYVCLSVLEVCEELRLDEPDLFEDQSPRDIANKIKSGFDIQGFFDDKPYIKMINQKSIQVHDAGIITFRLDGSWIAHRIDEMLDNGIDTWAPKYNTKAIFASHTETESWGSHLLVDCLEHALAQIYLYSGVAVCVSQRNVHVDVETIRHGVCELKANVNVFLRPHLHREAIEKCFAAARSEKWFPAQKATLACCGYRSLSFDQKKNLAHLWHMYFDDSFFISLAQESGYNPDKFFGCLLKYTLLKRYRMASVTFSMDEMIGEEGNTLVNILILKNNIRSIIENYLPSESEKALAGEGERELGLHLIEFTGVIERACKCLAPDLICEYLFDLSNLFARTRLARLSSKKKKKKVGKANIQLCKATEVVISKCLHLLGIGYSLRHSDLADIMHSDLADILHSELTLTVEEMRANEHRFSRSRFELFTMRVFVAQPYFDKGSIFGNIWVKDANLAREDGWTKVDKDRGYVSYFEHEWHKPLDIFYGSLIPFGNPSCRRSVPISSSLEVDVLLHAMSKNKQHCYLVFHGKGDEPISKNWVEQQEESCPETECGTLELESYVGSVQINYILLKDAIDASMELLCRSSNPNLCVKIRGYIIAYYGDLVKDDDILGRYKAVIFRTTNFELTGGAVLLLHKSLLAVPANGCLKIKAKLEDVESGKEYVCETRGYRARPSEVENWCIKCGKNFSINLKVAWSS